MTNFLFKRTTLSTLTVISACVWTCGGLVAEAPVAEAPVAEAPVAEAPVAEAPAVADVAESPIPVSAEEQEIAEAAVAKPVSAELVQVFGWREYVRIKGVDDVLVAKLDTGARTSSIHAEKSQLFERDGKKWVRFIVTDPTKKDSSRVQIEAPLVRIVLIKEPGGESIPREVVQLSMQIGERKMRAEFTLNNRDNMLAPVLIGRTLIKELGMVDPRRAYIAEKNILR